MAHKKKHTPRVPPGNRPSAGPANEVPVSDEVQAGGGAPFQEQDPQRRLGGFETAGEHARQQPSRLNDGQTHSE